MIGNNEKCFLLIFFIKHMQHLSGSKLKDNGIQSLVPSKHKTCHHKDHGIKGKDQIPCIHPFFL